MIKRAYIFLKIFSRKFLKKAESTPPEHLAEPKASIAGPTLQGLAFTHKETNLKEMFLNLLATSMDNRKANVTHPVFVEIIKQLNSEEAGLVTDILQSQRPMPIVEIYTKLNINSDENSKLLHLLNLKDTETAAFIKNSSLPAMVDNWIKLGLVTVDYRRHLADKPHYSWVEKRLEYVNLCEKLNDEHQKVQVRNGVIYSTELGKQFAATTGVL